MLTVFLSAGHSQSDPGAVANGVTEAALTLELRDALTLALADRGIAVMTDGRRGENLPLREAVKIAAKNPNGLNLEFHFNAGPPGAAGVEVLSNARHKRTAQAIAGAIASVTRSPLRGEGGWKPENAGQHHRLAFVQAGGLIVETCFISNPKDLAAYRARFGDVVNVLAGTIATIAKGGGQSIHTGHKATPVPVATAPAQTVTVTNPVAPTVSAQIQPVAQAPTAQPSKLARFSIAYQFTKIASGVLTASAAFLANYKWPLLVAGAFLLGLVIAWQFQPTERKTT